MSTFKWAAFGPLMDSESWDYAPSWMADTVVGYDRMWWTGNVLGGKFADVIRHSHTINGVWQPPIVVLESSGRGWEGICSGDPAVVRGAFSVGGQSYNQAMYYTAAPNCASDNKIGVAFSNDGVNWTKYAGNPILKSAGNHCPDPAQVCLSSYGAGQAQARNWNGQAGVELWYFDTNGAQGTGIYEVISSDGIQFSHAQRLSIAGLGCGPESLGGPAVALSPSPPWLLYLLIRRNKNLAMFNIPFDQRFTGTWTFLDEFTSAQAGAGAVFEAGFRTDIYGNLSATTWPAIWAGFGAGPCYVDTPYCDPTQWSLRQAGGS